METILLVDDETFFLDRMSRAFVRRGYTTYMASSYEEAMAIVAEQNPPLAVIDLKMPGKSGLQLLKDALELSPLLQVVVLTGYGSIATATEAIKIGAVAYLAKPADVDEIVKAFGSDELKREQEEVELTTPSLARVEWEHIQRVLTDCDDNISSAAKRLGIHRRTLQRKLYKYAPKK